MPNTHDANGRPWAKLSELKVDDEIELDGGFTCIGAGLTVVRARPNGDLYFDCDDDGHSLSGQADDGEHCVGVYKVGQS